MFIKISLQANIINRLFGAIQGIIQHAKCKLKKIIA